MALVAMVNSTPAGQLADAIRIPPLSASVERVRALLDSPDVSFDDVVKALQQDPALTARTLRIANSAHYGLSEPVTCIQKAVTVLGLRMLSSIVLRAGVMSIYADKQDTKGICLRDIWKHSVLMAQISEDLARLPLLSAKRYEPQVYYTCGLLLDIGKIVLYDNFGDVYVDILRNGASEGRSLAAEELHQLGINHIQAGHIAAVRWSLPEPIPSVLRGPRHHAQPELADLASAVACADEIASAITEDPTAKPTDIVAQVKTRQSGVTEPVLLQVIAIAADQWSSLEV